MSRSGEIALEFGGEERTFRLTIKAWEKVQEKCDAGPGELLARLSPTFEATKAGLSFEQIMAMGLLGNWRIHDVREPILQGLLAANMAQPDALRLVRDWVDERPLIEAVAVAYRVVLASVIGTEDEAAVGESRAAGAGSHPSHAASTDLEKTAITRSAGRSAGRPTRSAP